MLIVGLISCTPQDDLIKNSIKQSYNDYINAINHKDYKLAYALLDSESIRYYDTILSLTKFAEKARLEKEDLMTKLSVLTFRYCFSDSEILSMKKEDVFSYGFKKMNYTQTPVSHLINIEIDTLGIVKYAKADIANDSRVFEIGIGFTKENNKWKINVLRSYVSLNILFKMEIEKQKTDEDKFIKRLIEHEPGQKSSEEIWQPIINKQIVEKDILIDSNFIAPKKNNVNVDWDKLLYQWDIKTYEKGSLMFLDVPFNRPDNKETEYITISIAKNRFKERPENIVIMAPRIIKKGDGLFLSFSNCLSDTGKIHFIDFEDIQPNNKFYRAPIIDGYYTQVYSSERVDIFELFKNSMILYIGWRYPNGGFKKIMLPLSSFQNQYSKLP
jgi:hypothetical protein